jgi:hypothetical protein
LTCRRNKSKFLNKEEEKRMCVWGSGKHKDFGANDKEFGFHCQYFRNSERFLEEKVMIYILTISKEWIRIWG